MPTSDLCSAELVRQVYHHPRVRFSVHDVLPWQSNRFRAFIWRDGAWHPVSHVIEAHTREGWLERYAVKDGAPYLDETRDEAVTERLEGWICVRDVGNFWKELCGAINWVLLESRFGRTILPGGITPYKDMPLEQPTPPTSER